MNEQIREQLVGYALGALDADEQRELEERLATDPELRRELESVQDALEPLAAVYEDHEAPEGLAERACAYVADEAERLHHVHPARFTSTGGYEPTSRWTLGDWVVVGGICAAAVLLFFPAVLNSRIMARVTTCQNNLRELGTSLVHYSEYVGKGCFPLVPVEGNQAFAGVYSPKLRDAGMLDDVRVVICPDSDMAVTNPVFQLPTCREIDLANADDVLVLQKICGGSYGYVLGVVIDHRYLPVRNQHRPTFALMADLPATSWKPSPHRHGRNILYEDQHIEFVTDCPDMQFVDDPFCNLKGRQEAGMGIHDAVVAPSDCPPIRNLNLWKLR